MWFIFALITIFFWGGSDLFSKMGSNPKDKYSHWKIVVAVGFIMGVHATVMLVKSILAGDGFDPAVFLKYSPAIILYIGSMVLGYIGLRYIMLSVSSPICNSSGAVACILCLIFLKQLPDTLTWIGIALVTIGVIGLAFVEKKNDQEAAELSKKGENKKYVSSFIAIFFPIFYCILDGLGTFADAILLDKGIVNEDYANIAYEYTFFACGLIAFIFVYIIKREKLKIKEDLPKLAGGLCETAGQFFYIYAIGDNIGNPTVATPMISAYCVFSVLLSRIFLKEKLSLKHYAVVFTVFAGIIFMGVAEGLA
ncbi:MAG: DMT family transporter [Clostridia bacterium]|nr:DMT family transporter [Clostridia bacterium]